VTRLGEFSPKLTTVYFGQFFENYISSPHFWLLFSKLIINYKLVTNFDKK
jgi:hypothetical protein